eukprot:g7688.t1
MRTTFSTIALCLVLCVAGSHAAELDRALKQKGTSVFKASLHKQAREDAIPTVKHGLNSGLSVLRRYSDIDFGGSVFAKRLAEALEAFISKYFAAVSELPQVNGCKHEQIDVKELSRSYAETWVYPPLDFVLQTCVGIASWLIWRKGGFVDQRIPLTLYGIQLALTAIWTPLFFNAHKVKLAFAELVVLDVVTTATALQFYDQSKTAGYLMTPFLAFLVFETARILRIAIDNPDADKIEEQESVKESVSIQTPPGTPSVDHNSASRLVPDHVRAEPPAVAGTSKVEEAKKTN